MPGIDSMPPIRSCVTSQATTASASSAPSRASWARSSRDAAERALYRAASKARPPRRTGWRRPDPPSKAKSMPNALTRDLVARAIVRSSPAGWKMLTSLAGLPSSLPNGNDLLHLDLAVVADLDPVGPVLVRDLHRHALQAELFADQRPERLHRPAELAAEHRRRACPPARRMPGRRSAPRGANCPRSSPSACRSSRRRSARSTSTPSTSPDSTSKTRNALQRSRSAPRSSDTVHGHGTSQEQFSKYWPSIFQPPMLSRSPRTDSPMRSTLIAACSAATRRIRAVKAEALP